MDTNTKCVNWGISDGDNRWSCLVAEDTVQHMKDKDFVMSIRDNALAKGVRPNMPGLPDLVIHVWTAVDGDGNASLMVGFPEILESTVNQNSENEPSQPPVITVPDSEDLSSPPPKKLLFSQPSPVRDNRIINSNLRKSFSKLSPFKSLSTQHGSAAAFDNDDDDLGVSKLDGNRNLTKKTPSLQKSYSTHFSVSSKFLTVHNLPESFSPEILLSEINRSLWSSETIAKPKKGAVKCIPEKDGDVVVEFISPEVAAETCNIPVIEYKDRVLIFSEKEVKCSGHVIVKNLPGQFSHEILLNEINRALWTHGKIARPNKGAVKCTVEENGVVIVEFTSAEMAAKACDVPVIEYKDRVLELSPMGQGESTSAESCLSKFVEVYNFPDPFSKVLVLHEINRGLWTDNKLQKSHDAAIKCSDRQLDGSVLVEFTFVEMASEACKLKSIEYEVSPLLLVQRKEECSRFIKVLNVPVNFSQVLLLHEINRQMWAHDFPKGKDAAVDCSDRYPDGSVIAEFSSVEAALKACRGDIDFEYDGLSILMLAEDSASPNDTSYEANSISSNLHDSASHTEDCTVFDDCKNSDPEWNEDDESSSMSDEDLPTPSHASVPKWKKQSTQELVDCVKKAHKGKHIDTWTDSDWKKNCAPLLKKFGFNHSLCKLKMKRMWDYYRICVKQGRDSWLYYKDMAFIYSKSIQLDTEQVELNNNDAEGLSDSDTCDGASKVLTSKTTSKKGNAWTEPETFALIDEWAKYKDLQLNSVPKREIWHRVQTGLAESGFPNRTSKQCASRMAKLLEIIKKMVDAGKQTGNGASEYWPYYDTLYMLLSKDITITPKFNVACGSSNIVYSELDKKKIPEEKVDSSGLHRKSKAEQRDDRANMKLQAQLQCAAALKDLTDVLRSRSSTK